MRRWEAMSLLKYNAEIAIDVDQNTKKEAIDWRRGCNLDDIKATFAVHD